MKLFKISQTINQNWDTYDSAVVAAPDEGTARTIIPGISEMDEYDTVELVSEWATPENVTVEYLGEAKEGTPEGVICSSFNAGYDN
jgi:hypothetical protein